MWQLGLGLFVIFLFLLRLVAGYWQTMALYLFSKGLELPCVVLHSMYSIGTCSILHMGIVVTFSRRSRSISIYINKTSNIGQAPFHRLWLSDDYGVPLGFRSPGWFELCGATPYHSSSSCFPFSQEGDF